MFYLLASVVLSSYLTLAFKLLQRYNIPILPAIVFNYITCVLTGSLVNQTVPISGFTINQPWFVWALLTGGLFISLFNLIGYITQQMGVTVSSVANKLSMVIAVVFFSFFYKDAINAIKIIGVLLAILAVVLTCYKPSTNNQKSRYILPIILFLGSGLLDALFKWVTDAYLGTSNSLLNQYLTTSFCIAGILGCFILLYQYIKYKALLSYKAIIAGVLIGVPNYFSIYYLGKVYSVNLLPSSEIIPVNNIAIVLLSTLLAYLLFSEKLNKYNWFGIILSVVAIVLIAFNQYLY